MSQNPFGEAFLAGQEGANKNSLAQLQQLHAAATMASTLASLQEHQAKMREQAKKTAFYSPDNQAKFMSAGTPATPEISLPPDVAGPTQPGSPGTPGQFDFQKFLQSAAQNGVINPEVYANHLLTNETKKAALENSRAIANQNFMMNMVRINMIGDENARKKARDEATIAHQNELLDLKRREADPFGLLGGAAQPGGVISPPMNAPPPTPNAAPIAPQGGVLQPPVPGGYGGLQSAVPAALARGNNIAANEAQPAGGGLLPANQIIPGAPSPQQADMAAPPNVAAGPTAPLAAPPSAPAAAPAAAPMPVAAPGPNIAPPTQPPGVPGITSPPAEGPHGEEFLKRLPPALQGEVKKYAEGRMPVPAGFALKSPYFQQLMQAVTQYDPEFSATRYPVRLEFQKGKTATNVVAIGQSINHMGTLLDLGDALKNHDLQRQNQFVNFLRNETGDPKVNNFDTAKQAVGTELMRVFRQVNASEVETKAWEDRFSAANSPEKIKGALQVATKLLSGRINEINNQWDNAMGTKGGYPNILSPQARAAMQKIGGEGAAVADRATSKSGKPMHKENGQWVYD